MNTLPETVGRVVEASGVLPSGSRIVVAVSGGVDSMALLHSFVELAPIQSWTLLVAHLNHQLRGRSSTVDARFVQERCRAVGVPCVVERRDVRGVARRHKLSIEMAARQVRHQFLSQVARRRKCSVIALAHHADDQAELVLMRLLRGAGSEGLGGMRIVGVSPADPGVRLIRPLLGVRRTEILAFAERAGIGFREDRSNVSPRFLRNRVRHELLPILRKGYQPAIDEVLARTASVLSAESDCIRELACRWLRRGRPSFDSLPLAVKRRAVQLQTIELGLSIDFDACEKLVRQAGQTVSVPGGGRVCRNPDGHVSAVPRRDISHFQAEHAVKVAGRGKTRFAGRDFEWRVLATRPKGWRPRGAGQSESFDAGAVGSRILLRHWRAGDRFQPIGMDRPVKLQDIFTNQKVPAGERRCRVVAEAESGEVFWVEGLRIGERFKVGPNTREWLVWRWNC